MGMTSIGSRRANARADSTSLYEARRRRLLQAAATVFRAKGFQGATLKDVAVELGGDRASIYYYFESKQELFEAVVEDAVTSNVAAAAEIRDSKRPPIAKLRAILEALVRSYDEHYPHLFVFLQEDPARLAGASPEWVERMRDWSRDYYKIVREIIVEGLEQGSLTSTLPPSVIAQGVIGMANWTHRWYEPGGALDADQIGEGFAEIVLSGLATRRPRRRR
jgi:AcrR family transcriptional regulator